MDFCIWLWTFACGYGLLGAVMDFSREFWTFVDEFGVLAGKWTLVSLLGSIRSFDFYGRGCWFGVAGDCMCWVLL